MSPSSSCTLEKEAAVYFETPALIYQTTLLHIREESIFIVTAMETSNHTE
jgi:hypothetical protein